MFSADFPVSSRRGGKLYSRPEVSGGHAATAGGLRGPPLQLLVAGRARPWLSRLRALLLWRLRKYLRRGSRRSSAATSGQVKNFKCQSAEITAAESRRDWKKCILDQKKAAINNSSTWRKDSKGVQDKLDEIINIVITLPSILLYNTTFIENLVETDWQDKQGTELADAIYLMVNCSVADTDLNSDPEPHVFGPPGSGPISQRYGFGSGSGSGSFSHQAKIVRKPLISTVLWLFFEKWCKCTFKK
jgi:hypothetical protein